MNLGMCKDIDWIGIFPMEKNVAEMWWWRLQHDTFGRMYSEVGWWWT